MAIHEWAFEVDSDVYVHANDAIKSKPYRCTDPLCTQEIRRRAGSKTPHFYHLNPDADATCGGGEGPRHKRAKELIAKAFRESGKFQSVMLEQKIGRFIVDILIQTDYGPFYFEVIDTHEPEDANWDELDGRIIPFWITNMDDTTLEYADHYAFKLMESHFTTIGHIVTDLKHYELKKFDFSIEDVWYYENLKGVFYFVQEIHKQVRSSFPPNYPKPHYFREDEIKLGYKLAAKRLRNEMKKN